MPVALDTNILVYVEGMNDPARQEAAIAAVSAAREAEGVAVPAQVLGELFNVLTRKGRIGPGAARQAVAGWAAAATVLPTTEPVIAEAMEIAALHRLAFWDAVILAAAAQAGCRVLLSEDMQHGFAWRGVTVRNPFP